jgi:hypothetical protein
MELVRASPRKNFVEICMSESPGNLAFILTDWRQSIYTTAVEEPVDSAPPETPLSEISDPVVHHLPYSPPESVEQPCGEGASAAKINPSDDFQIPSEEAKGQPAAFEGPSAQIVYPLYEVGITHEPESPDIWCPDYKSAAIGAYDGYNALAYDIIEPVSSGSCSDGAGYELAPYDLPFSDMSEQVINDISECYM